MLDVKLLVQDLDSIEVHRRGEGRQSEVMNIQDDDHVARHGKCRQPVYMGRT